MKVLPAIGSIFVRYALISIIFYKKGHFKFNFLYFDKKTLSFSQRRKMKEKKTAQNSKMLSNILKKRFFTNFKSRCDDSSKNVTTALCLTNFSYLFYLINCKIMMRSIYKLTLKATVAVYNILETDILILKNSGLHKIKTLLLSRVLLNHCH